MAAPQVLQVTVAAAQAVAMIGMPEARIILAEAALAVEAAAQQGALEPMFQRMFESQAQWGEKGDQSQAPMFRTFAEELGLDMALYDAAIADPATLDRIQFDFNEGRALGVDSTPTFFLDGEKLQLQAFEDVEAAIKERLGQ